jgi:hypothetical protein
MTDITYALQNNGSKIKLSDNGDGTYSEATSVIGSGASGITPVTGTFNGLGTSLTLIPRAMRSFNIFLWGTFAATVVLERSFDGGTTWLPLRVGPAYSYSVPISDTFQDGEYGNQYRFRCSSYVSGAINYRISQ